MSKRIDTPEGWKKFSGYVEMRDPLPLLAVLTWEEAIQSIQAKRKDETGLTVIGMNVILLPAILACVESWHIDGVPEAPTMDTFPGTPRIASDMLVGWLIDKIRQICVGEGLEESDPNE
jgi:hypothetical protein